MTQKTKIMVSGSVTGSTDKQNSTFECKILKKTGLTGDVIHFEIAKPKKFEYQAGQFVQFQIPDPKDATKTAPRAYSMCSTPKDKNLGFCVKIIPGGLSSDFLKQIKEGDDITIKGPFGQFITSKENACAHFVATGVGISPIMGMIRNLLENESYKNPIHLFFGLRVQSDMFWIKEFDDLKNKYPNFDYILTLSRPVGDWKGLKGWVTNHLPEKVNKGDHFYLCGNVNMITDVKNLLIRRGLPEKNIHFEML